MLGENEACLCKRNWELNVWQRLWATFEIASCIVLLRLSLLCLGIVKDSLEYFKEQVLQSVIGFLTAATAFFL